MKLLWFSHFVPYPPAGGSHQRSFHLLRHVARACDTTLVAFNLRNEPAADLAGYAEELRRYCRQVEFWEMPVRWRGPRWWSLLAASALNDTPFVCRAFWSRRLEQRFRALLDAQPWTLLHFDSPDLGLYAAVSAGFRKVLTHHNCESAMAERRAENEREPVRRVFLRRQARKLAALEREVCPQFEVNLAVSPEDAQLLAERSPECHIHVVENGTDTDYFRPAAGSPEPDTLVFCGSLDWYPNVSGLEFFAERIWPQIIQARPGVRMRMVGRNPAPSLRRWAERDARVELIANPPDVRPAVSASSVFICPIRDGGGTRLKILDALAMGKPVVTTRIGCEGLGVEPGRDLLLADSPEEFARATLALLGDRELCRRLGQAGRRLAEAAYDWRYSADALLQAYRCAEAPGRCKPGSRPLAGVSGNETGARA